MAVYCKMCGAIIEYKKGETIGVCGSCGARQMMPPPIGSGNAGLYAPAGGSGTAHGRGGQLLSGIGSGLEKAAPLKETAVRQIGKVKRMESGKRYALFAAICFFLAALVAVAELRRFFNINNSRWDFYIVGFYRATLLLLGVTLLLRNKAAVVIAAAEKLLLLRSCYLFTQGGASGFCAAAYVALIVLLILAWKKKKAAVLLWFSSGILFGAGIIGLIIERVNDGSAANVLSNAVFGLCIEAAALFLTGLWLRREGIAARQRQQRIEAAVFTDGR